MRPHGRGALGDCLRLHLRLRLRHCVAAGTFVNPDPKSAAGPNCAMSGSGSSACTSLSLTHTHSHTHTHTHTHPITRHSPNRPPPDHHAPIPTSFSLPIPPLFILPPHLPRSLPRPPPSPASLARPPIRPLSHGMLSVNCRFGRSVDHCQRGPLQPDPLGGQARPVAVLHPAWRM